MSQLKKDNQDFIVANSPEALYERDAELALQTQYSNYNVEVYMTRLDEQEARLTEWKKRELQT